MKAIRVFHFTAVLALLLPGCRGDSGAMADPGAAGGVITLWTDSTELFLEHPALVVGEAGKFAVHLTDISDFAPLRSGSVTMRFVPVKGGPPVVVTQETPRAPGIYGPAPVFTAPGVYDLTILVDGPQIRDSISVPGLRVYQTEAEAPREDAGGDGGISFLKEQQWKTAGFRTAFAEEGAVSATINATGTIEPAAGRYAEISAPISGLVGVSGLAESPAPGQRVRQGQVLAVLTPSLGEAGSVYADARARLREAEDEYERAKRLVDAGAAPQRRLHGAENRLQAAREGLAGFGGGEAGGIEIRSPVAGVVARRSITPGSRVEAGTALFTVVDPSVVWLMVNVPAAQAALVGRSSGASFRLEGGDRRFSTRQVISTGTVIDSESRTLEVIYDVPNPDGAIRIGAVARAEVQTGERTRGLVIPASAVLDEDGRSVVYVQPEGETFLKREVRIGGREGDRVLVLEGLSRGERVVTGAPYQVRLASLSTSVPEHGHEH